MRRARSPKTVPVQRRPEYSAQGKTEIWQPASILIKIAGALVLGWGIYIYFMVHDRYLLQARDTLHGNDGEIGVMVVEDVEQPHGKASDSGRRYGYGHTYRHLDMLGLEDSSQRDGNWKTCKAYRETDLVPHKKVRDDEEDGM